MCAATDPTTEAHLSAAGDATELFRWLRSLPFVDAGPRGLHLRSFVREAIRYERHGVIPGPGRRRRLAHPRPGTPRHRRSKRRSTGDARRHPRRRHRRPAIPVRCHARTSTWQSGKPCAPGARPDLLATNPLTSSRLVAESAEPDHVAALRAVLQAALDGLSEDPRETKGHRAVLATYLGGAPTQEAAAERLGLPFSTYRRHLAQGLAVLASLLWWQETRDGLPG